MRLRGSLAVDGRKIAGPSRGVGAVFQAPVLLPWRTIEENVLLPADVMKLDRPRATERAHALLQMAGLGGFERKYPYELSGGMQHRASIVRALVHDPKLLIMDEPFAALDAITREQMATELQRIWMDSRKTVMFITHSISEAVFLSDRIAVMSARPGRIVDIFNNRAPRPRSFADLLSPALAELSAEIRRSLRPRLRRIDDRASRMADIVNTEPKAAEAVPRRRASGIAWRILERLLSLTILLLIIEGGIRGFEVPPYVFPTPSAIGVALYQGVAGGTYLPALAVTLTEILIGFVIGSTCGILLGIAMVQVPLLDRIVYPYVVGLQTVPKVAIAPLMIVWFGFGISSKIFIVAVTCLFPSLVNTIAGLRAVDSDRIALIPAMCGTRRATAALRATAECPALHHGWAQHGHRACRDRRHRRRVCRRQDRHRRADPAS